MFNKLCALKICSNFKKKREIKKNVLQKQEEKIIQKTSFRNMNQKLQILSLVEILVQNEVRNCRWETGILVWVLELYNIYIVQYTSERQYIELCLQL